MKSAGYFVAAAFWIFGIAVAKGVGWTLFTFLFPPAAWVIGMKWLIARYL